MELVSSLIIIALPSIILLMGWKWMVKNAPYPVNVVFNKMDKAMMKFFGKILESFPNLFRINPRPAPYGRRGRRRSL